MIIKKSVLPFRTFGPNLYKEKEGIKYISSTHGELYPLKKPENTFRVVCFGGSTTRNEWTFRKYKLHYPLILERKLQKAYPDRKIEVINIGNDAYSTPHFLIQLELDVISWDPDLVIISENINDLSVSYWKNYSFDYSNKYGTKYYLPDYEKKYTTINALFRWSSFYWFIKEKIDLISASNKEKEKNTTVEAPVKEKRRKSFGNEPTKLSKYIFRRNLLDFYYLAEKWNIPVLFASQPQKENTGLSDYLPDSKEMRQLMYYVSVEEKAAHHKIFNNIIREVARTTNSYFVDNDSLLAGNPKYFIDAVHYTKAGIEKIAEDYFNYIVSKNIINQKGKKDVKALSNL